MEFLCGGGIGKKSRGHGGGGSLRGLYTTLFRLYGTLPKEISAQDPFVLFKMLDELEEAEDAPPDLSGSEHLRMFYGK
ncbi:MAG: hypothetical protein SOS24_05865 [Clostridia bacterium]|nr:hypothetical protein [Clostridia bacterium]